MPDAETDPMPTEGSWRYDVFNGRHIVDALHKDATKMVATVNLNRGKREAEANGELIAAAGTAASEIQDMGYDDPIEMVEALPDLVRELERAYEYIGADDLIDPDTGRLRMSDPLDLDSKDERHE